MGGKLSEGINFKDEMARGVIGSFLFLTVLTLFQVIGMPYPNKNDPLLQCKIQYLNKAPPMSPQAPKKSTTTTTKPVMKSSINSDEYYENLCMNTINQSIGIPYHFLLTMCKVDLSGMLVIMLALFSVIRDTTDQTSNKNSLSGFLVRFRQLPILVPVIASLEVTLTPFQATSV